MKFIAKTGLDFNRGRKENVRYDMDGELELSSRNLLLDPAFREFRADGSLRYWPRLGAPASPVGRYVYCGRGARRDTRQTQNLVPLEQAAYWQIREIRSGPAAPTPKANDYPEPLAPHLKLYEWDGDGGYPQGQYGKSYAWVIGTLQSGAIRFLTNSAPRTIFSLPAGGSYLQLLPEAAPPLATGLAMLQTQPDDANGALYIHRIIDIRSGVPEYYVMDGPSRSSAALLAPGRGVAQNETYRGAFNEHPAPEYSFRPGKKRLKRMDCLVSYRFRTRMGLSASQGVVNLVVPAKRRDRSARLTLDRLPAGLVSVVWQIRARDGLWYDVYSEDGSEADPREPFWLPIDDPEELTNTHRYELVLSERSRIDETGVPGPNAPFEGGKIITDSTVRAGNLRVSVTDVYENDDGSYTESRPSAPTTLTTTDGDIVRVGLLESQAFGNLLPSATYEEREVDGSPVGWTLDSGVTARDSVLTLNTSSGGDLATHVERVPIDATQTYAVRGATEMTSGTADVRLRVYAQASGGSALSTIVIAASDADEEATIGPEGSGAAHAWPAGTTHAQMVVYSSGAAIGEVYHLGFFLGGAVPRKRLSRDLVPDGEPKAREYPPANYLRIVEEPDFAGGKGNALEYYGAANMPLRNQYLAYGLQLPVDEDAEYTISTYFSAAGASERTRLWPISVHAASGEVLLRPGSLVADASGTQSGRGVVTFTTPPGAAYVQFHPSTLGAGLVQVWGLQPEKGGEATEWTDDHELTGSIALTFDTAPPGYEDENHVLPYIFSPKRWLEIDTISDTPPGTEVSVSYRARNFQSQGWTEFTDDPEELLGMRYQDVLVELLTSDPDSSPTLSAVHLLAEPKRAQLYRADGSMYHGGILAEQVPAGGYAENTELSYNSDGSVRVHETFEAGEEITLSLKAFTDEGANQVMYDSTHGPRRFILEGWGKKREVVLANVRFTTNRMEKIMGRDYWLHVTDSLTAPVTYSELIEDEELTGV